MKKLNKPFHLEEIKKGIKRLRAKTALGIDYISSETIKCFNNVLLSKITKLLLLLVTTHNQEMMDLFIQYTKMVVKKTP